MDLKNEASLNKQIHKMSIYFLKGTHFMD